MPPQPTTILYFAWLREHTGTAEEHMTLAPETRTIADLVTLLRARSPGHDAAFASPSRVRAAVNQMFVQADAPIAPGDEIAFFPPITGG